MSENQTPVPVERQTLSLALLSHTNVGKTTLARTLLRRDVGEVLDQAHVTDEATPHTLLETRHGERMILWDTPGFGDSVRLLRDMEAAPDPLEWVRDGELDPHADRARYCSYQAVKSIARDCDVVLYLVNAAEAPGDAGYVTSEMQILSWTEKPVLVLLNQTGAAQDNVSSLDVDRWRAHLARWPIVRRVLSLDAFTRCWVEEGHLFEEIRDLFDGERKELGQRFLQAWRAERQETFRASMDSIAGELLRAARDVEDLVEGAWGNDKNQAMKALAGRMEEGSKAVMDRLIALHGLDGRGSIELRTVIEDFQTQAEKLAPKRWGVIGGAASGLLTGLTADIASGGMSFGAGLVIGAVAGGFGAAGVARAYNTVRGSDGARVSWSETVLFRTAEQLMLRYLAVAHFGRGRGAWSEREVPAFWKRSVKAGLQSRRVYFKGVWKEARKNDVDVAMQRSGLVAMLSGAGRDVLVEFYPESGHLVG